MRGMRPVIALAAALMLLATACPQEDDQQGGGGGDELRLGYILPESGQLAFLGPPMIAGIRMAVDEMEQAGGPRGMSIELSGGDEAGQAAVASEAANRLLGEDVHAIIGAAASGMTRAIIDQVTGAGVVQCSPSNTSAEFSDYEDGGFYFRTAPPDVLQGQVLANVILEDEHRRIALLGRADGYGRGLVESTQENLEAGGAEIVESQIYDPEATTFDSEVSAVAASNPDAVVLVTFEEGAQLIQGLLEAGITADQMYGVDGNRSSDLNTTVDPNNPNVLDGMKGTAPDPGAVEGFIDRLREFEPDLEETIFGPQSYDCAMLVGLAAVAADTNDPAEIAENIVPLTRGDNECTGFQECAGLLEDGETIKYRFVSGTEEFRDVGEPVNGVYEVWAWENGEFQAGVDRREISLEGE